MMGNCPGMYIHLIYLAKPPPKIPPTSKGLGHVYDLYLDLLDICQSSNADPKSQVNPSICPSTTLSLTGVPSLKKAYSCHNKM